MLITEHWLEQPDGKWLYDVDAHADTLALHPLSGEWVPTWRKHWGTVCQAKFEEGSAELEALRAQVMQMFETEGATFLDRDATGLH